MQMSVSDYVFKKSDFLRSQAGSVVLPFTNIQVKIYLLKYISLLKMTVEIFPKRNCQIKQMILQREFGELYQHYKEENIVLNFFL